MKLNSIEPFNDNVDMPPSYKAPADKFHPKGKVCILDCSGSMKSRESEFKLTLSMIKALAGLQSMPPVPMPTGRTNLIGKIKKVVESPNFGQQELIIVTDGYDNHDEINDFQVGVTESNEPLMVTIERGKYPSTDDYMRARQEAILDYLAFIGAQVHIIGIGKEVKNLLQMAASRPMTVAHVPESATPTQVATIVGAAIRTVRHTALSPSDFATAAQHITATAARVITVDNLCHQPVAQAEQVRIIEMDASRVYIGDDAFTIEMFKRNFATAEVNAHIGESAKLYTRGVVLWLLTLSLAKGKVPGAVIGGKLAKIFQPPAALVEWNVNKLLAELEKIGLVAATREPLIHVEIEGEARTFKAVKCYEVSLRAAHLVHQLGTDHEWATPERELVRKSIKRKHTESLQ